MRNVYFDLTAEFNRDGTIALLASGQAVVYYRRALMSKDGDWILAETSEACDRVRSVLAGCGARYRLGAPLDVGWLAGGWSSHFEFSDEAGRRIRCDFLSRPPRVPAARVRDLFGTLRRPGDLAVVDLESLILMKRTQRAKDYPVIGELARLLPAAQEVLYTTDPDRVLDLAPTLGPTVDRQAAAVAREGGSREAVVVAMAREIDRLQQEDRQRLDAYASAAERYVGELSRSGILDLPLERAHPAILDLADRLLPRSLPGRGEGVGSAS